MGLGLQGGGVGAVKFFSELKCRIRVTDLKKADVLQSSISQIETLKIDKFTFGENKIEDIDFADIVLVNPCVPHSSPIFQYAKSANKTIYMEEALFTWLSPIETIGITGTRGKTTTTTLISNLLSKKFPVHRGGNIPGSQTLMYLLDIKNESEKAVMELSSFQLSGFHSLQVSPNVSVLTNIYEDHLNVYASMNEYVFDKKAIYQYQKSEDFLIFNERFVDNVYFPNLKKEIKGQFLTFNRSDILGFDVKLSGEHNYENIAAAKKVAEIFQIEDQKIREVFSSFSGVPFRQQKIRELRGVLFVNDTTASTPTAAIMALKSFPKDKIILIAGGNSKNCDISEFVSQISERAKYVVLLKGDGTEELRNKLLLSDKISKEKISQVYDNFGQAIKDAYDHAKSDDVVLLSPGFTSFGMFNNEFERGEKFNEYVMQIQ